MDEERTCRRCNQTKSLDEFPSNGDERGGKRWQCKECMNKINRMWRSDNKERVSEYNRNRKNKE